MATSPLEDRNVRALPSAARAVAHVISHTDTDVVCVHGEIDLCTVRTLETALRDVVAASAPRVVVDLKSVGFMDGAGLRALRSAKLQVEQEDRSFTVRGARRAVLRLFEAAAAEDLLHRELAGVSVR